MIMKCFMIIMRIWFKIMVSYDIKLELNKVGNLLKKNQIFRKVQYRQDLFEHSIESHDSRSGQR
jgi:hypothetical protein